MVTVHVFLTEKTTKEMLYKRRDVQLPIAKKNYSKHLIKLFGIDTRTCTKGSVKFFSCCCCFFFFGMSFSYFYTPSVSFSDIVHVDTAVPIDLFA